MMTLDHEPPNNVDEYSQNQKQKLPPVSVSLFNCVILRVRCPMFRYNVLRQVMDYNEDDDPSPLT